MLNGEGKRQLDSWVDRFVEYTKEIDAPELFRRWGGIMTIASTLEQKVWIETTSALYPNLYIFLVGPPGTGKGRTMAEVAKLIRQLPNPYIAPTSINSSSMIDHLAECKRIIIQPPGPAIEYNTMTILVEEMGTFMHEYTNDLVDQLSAFYYVSSYMPYGQRRRGGDRKWHIERPQINMIIGSTPSNLLEVIPERAWSQGFTSRIVFVYSTEKKFIDDFGVQRQELPDDLIHDLKIINNLYGKFTATEDYRVAVNVWRQEGEFPKPTHPRLMHYNTRRKEHIYRLSMIASIDRSNTLILAKEDFVRAAEWLIEAEAQMPLIFSPASARSDDNVVQEMMHFVRSKGTATEPKIIQEAQKRMPIYAVSRLIEVMVKSNALIEVSKDRFGIKTYKASD